MGSIVPLITQYHVSREAVNCHFTFHTEWLGVPLFLALTVMREFLPLGRGFWMGRGTSAPEQIIDGLREAKVHPSHGEAVGEASRASRDRKPGWLLGLYRK